MLPLAQRVHQGTSPFQGNAWQRFVPGSEVVSYYEATSCQQAIASRCWDCYSSHAILYESHLVDTAHSETERATFNSSAIHVITDVKNELETDRLAYMNTVILKEFYTEQLLEVFRM